MNAKQLLKAGLAAALSLSCYAPLAVAGRSTNTIDPVALVTNQGRHVLVTGPITCTASEVAYLRVRVTQRATGAVAEGRTRLTCTGAPQHWEVQASVHGHESVAAGPATAVAFARTTSQGDTTDAHQWLVDITIDGNLQESLIPCF